VEISVGEQAVC